LPSQSDKEDTKKYHKYTTIILTLSCFWACSHALLKIAIEYRTKVAPYAVCYEPFRKP
jgi:hypothetical protein